MSPPIEQPIVDKYNHIADHAFHVVVESPPPLSEVQLQDPAPNLFCICRLPWRIEGPRPDDLICLFVYMPTKFMMGRGLMNVWKTMWGAFGGREYLDATRS